MERPRTEHADCICSEDRGEDVAGRYTGTDLTVFEADCGGKDEVNKRREATVRGSMQILTPNSDFGFYYGG